MNQTERLDVIAEIADEQRGFVTTAQAETVGVSRVEVARLASRGLLERVERGVYRLRGSGFDENSTLRAAWLAVHGPSQPVVGSESTIVVSHASAAALHRIGDIAADIAEFSATRRLQTIRDGIRMHRAELSDDDVVIVEGMPTTTVVRTLADLVADGHDGEHIGAAIGDAVRRGIVSLPALASALAPYASRRGYARNDGAALLDDLLRVAGLDRATLLGDLTQSSWARELLATGVLAGAQAAIADVFRNSAVADAVAAQFMDAIDWPTVDLSAFIDTSVFDAINEQLNESFGAATQPLLDAIAHDASWLKVTDLLQVTQTMRQLESLEAAQ